MREWPIKAKSELLGYHREVGDSPHLPFNEGFCAGWLNPRLDARQSLVHPSPASCSNQHPRPGSFVGFVDRASKKEVVRGEE